MKKLLMLSFVAAGLWFSGCATSNTANSSNDHETYRTEEQLTNSKLNNRRLEKNLDRFAKELNLTKRQQKQLKKIDKRYARLERKLSKRDDTRRSDKRRLSEEKRLEMIDVLTAEQEQTLQALAKKGRFSWDQIFGK
jgi:Spy/CpxP family protein refolding chaperone